MYEITIENKLTKEEKVIFGYNNADAFRRHKLEQKNWRVIAADYVD